MFITEYFNRDLYLQIRKKRIENNMPIDSKMNKLVNKEVLVCDGKRKAFRARCIGIDLICVNKTRMPVIEVKDKSRYLCFGLMVLCTNFLRNAIMDLTPEDQLQYCKRYNLNTDVTFWGRK